MRFYGAKMGFYEHDIEMGFYEMERCFYELK